MSDKIYIFDTTLRDGAQTQGVDFSLDDKEKISLALDNLGVDYIEGGWPGANPTDTEFFNKKHTFNNSILTAFGMTKKTDHSAENDPMISSLINSKANSICLVHRFRRRPLHAQSPYFSRRSVMVGHLLPLEACCVAEFCILLRKTIILGQDVLSWVAKFF